MTQAPDEPVPAEDTPREHPQDPAEGPDEQQEREPDVPRVHPDDPAEGPPSN
jgi:hypothetical protein